MPTIKPTRILLAATALLACTPGKGDSASDTDPSTGGTATTTSSTSLTGTGGHTSTSDPSTGATSTSTGDDAITTTGPTTEIGSTSTGHVTTHPGTTTTGDEPCGSGWCTTKDVLNIILYDNHEPPHELEISAVDAALCVEQTFEFTGPADHTHTVTFTAEHFAIMDVGGSIEVESSEAQGHTHKVWSDCE